MVGPHNRRLHRIFSFQLCWKRHRTAKRMLIYMPLILFFFSFVVVVGVVIVVRANILLVVSITSCKAIPATAAYSRLQTKERGVGRATKAVEGSWRGGLEAWRKIQSCQASSCPCFLHGGSSLFFVSYFFLLMLLLSILQDIRYDLQKLQLRLESETDPAAEQTNSSIVLQDELKLIQVWHNWEHGAE